jgi:hypothetical protein
VGRRGSGEVVGWTEAVVRAGCEGALRTFLSAAAAVCWGGLVAVMVVVMGGGGGGRWW